MTGVLRTPRAAPKTSATVTVALDGDLEYACAEKVLTRLRAAIDQAGDGLLVIDLRGVSFCDAAGLRVLIKTAANDTSRCHVVLANPGRFLRRIMEVTELTGVFDIIETTATPTDYYR